MNPLELALLDLARQLGPDVVRAVVALGRSALAGAPAADLRRDAEKLATMTAFKASYRKPARDV